MSSCYSLITGLNKLQNPLELLKILKIGMIISICYFVRCNVTSCNEIASTRMTIPVYFFLSYITLSWNFCINSWKRVVWNYNGLSGKEVLVGVVPSFSFNFNRERVCPCRLASVNFVVVWGRSEWYSSVEVRVDVGATPGTWK